VVCRRDRGIARKRVFRLSPEGGGTFKVGKGEDDQNNPGDDPAWRGPVKRNLIHVDGETLVHPDREPGPIPGADKDQPRIAAGAVEGAMTEIDWAMTSRLVR
jgi:hypothetical protein